MVFSVHFKMHVLCVSNRHQGTQAWRLWRAVTGRCWFLRTFEYACSLRLKPPSGHAGVAPLARSHKPRCVPPYIRICMFSASQAALRARRRGAFGAQSQAEVCFSAHSNMHVLCVSSHSQGTQAARCRFLRTFESDFLMRLKPRSGHAGGARKNSRMRRPSWDESLPWCGAASPPSRRLRNKF